MDKIAVEPRRDCWICFSNENNVTITIEDSEKVLNNCVTYLDTCIIKKPFENDEAGLSCCRYCYESAHQLTLLEEQIQKIQKEISDLSFLFSKNVLERRSVRNTAKDESANQMGECLLNQKDSDGNPIDMFENVNVKNEVIESETKELLSESGILTGRDNLVTDLWFNSDNCENVVQNNYENVIHSEDDTDVKHSYDETVSEGVNSRSPNSEPNHQLMSTTTAACIPKTTKQPMFNLLKCFKTPIIQLERIQLCKSRSSPKIVSLVKIGAVEENIKSEKALDDSRMPNTCNAGSSSEKVSKSKALRFKCPEISCLKSFAHKHVLVRHRKIHSRERPYKCSFCSKSFKVENYLQIHEKIHSEERPYKCSFCSKSYKRSGHLKEHERTHSGEKPYNCSFCSKTFRIGKSLKDHERTHSGERPYKCSFCSKTFKIWKTLKDHEKIHSVVKQYKCSNCEKTFATKSNLTAHRSRTHGVCNEEFILS